MYQVVYLVAVTLSLLIVGCDPKFTSSSEPAKSIIPGRYIVVMNEPMVVMAAKNLNYSTSRLNLIKTLSAQIEKEHDLSSARHLYSETISGGVYDLNPSQVETLKKNPLVSYIEEDQIVSANATVQSDATWGLDRINQVALPLDKKYSYVTDSSNVKAYVIDTGILTKHEEFSGRATSGIDLVDGDSDATDCNGHGTHVAGTIGGRKFGVAKNVSLIAVRVLNCQGQGSISGVIAGVEWVAANHRSPAVANMSLGGGSSQALDDAVKAAVASGVTFVVAAGNESYNACYSSPAREKSAITVGSTDKADKRSYFSNFGTCVDIFAPGSDVMSAWSTSTAATKTISGTSMASPHVAGVAALYLALHPTAQPSEVQTAIVNGAIKNKLTDVLTGSPNLMLNTTFLDKANVPPPAIVVPPCTNCGVLVGMLSAKGQQLYVPNGTYYLIGSAGTHRYWLRSSAAGTDFNLYLYRWSGSSWLQVASSTTANTSSEQISYAGAAGYYALSVVSASGAGTFEVYRQVPK